jgi:hypothetical protein
MKRILFTLVLLSSAVTFAQKKIVAFARHQFMENGDFQEADSSSYIYDTYLGSVTSNEPWFGVVSEEVVPLWNWDGQPDPNYTSAEFWNGTAYPLTLGANADKTYNGNNQCTLKEMGFTRTLYTYTTSGKIASETQEQNVMGVWQANSSKGYEYDGSDRLVVYNKFQNQSGSLVHMQSDTLDYDGSNTTISKAISYSSIDGIVFKPSFESILSFTGGQIETLKYFEDDDGDAQTPMIYMNYAEYIHTNGKLTSINIYDIIQGAPGQTMVAQFAYAYNVNGQLSKRTSTGFDEEILNFTYDNEGYMDSVLYEYLDLNQNYYNALVEKFYYQNTANLDGQNKINLSVYPNPTMDELRIETQEEVESITIYNTAGQIVLRQSGSNHVNLSKLPGDQYIISISTTNGVSTHKVIKQ